jgi:hypothetical protein
MPLLQIYCRGSLDPARPRRRRRGSSLCHTRVWMRMAYWRKGVFPTF